MDHSQVDGMDVVTVLDHVKPIVESMRKTPRAYLLEALTYRYRGHSVSDPGHYRTKEEVKEYQERDPISRLAERLKKDQVADDAKLEAWDEEARQKAAECEDWADQSPPAKLEDAWTDVYVD
jgi:pyruvate dehydrogenase E1 component alpha subunit